MKKILILSLAGLMMLGTQTAALADSHVAKVEAYVKANVYKWLGDAELHSVITQQNINHAALKPADIDALDKRWRAEKSIGHGEFMDSVMSNEVSAFLRGVKAASGGIITEIFVMDNKGMNVGQTNGTGDYMQGDEAKWQKTYPVSAYGIFIDAVEEEDGINIAQASVTIARQNTARIGAVTIGINVDALK